MTPSKASVGAPTATVRLRLREGLARNVDVTRLPESERIIAARRAAMIERLGGGGMLRAMAEAWREYDADHKPPPPDTSSNERDPVL